MMNLVVDIGNSRTKLAIFEGEEEIYFCSSEKEPNEIICEIRQQYPQINAVIVSCVKHLEAEDLLLNDLHFFEFTEKLHIPVENKYKTPATLGKDRLAAAVGAFVLFPDRNNLIIDAGTCITIDFLDSRNCYHGGAILLGVHKKAEALHTFTEKLPLIKLELQEPIKILGENTIESLQSGVLNGTLFEVSGFIRSYINLYEDLNIIITGGEMDYLVKNLELKTSACPNLVLVGLNKILNINA